MVTTIEVGEAIRRSGPTRTPMPRTLVGKTPGDASRQIRRGTSKDWRQLSKTSPLTPARYRSHSRGTVLTVTLRGDGVMSIARSAICAFSAAVLFGVPVFGGSAEAQTGRVYRVAVVLTAADADTKSYTDAFRSGLRDLGYIEGRNLILDVRSTEGDSAKLSAVVDQAIALSPMYVSGGSRSRRSSGGRQQQSP